jgi:hypothetical protein
MPAQPFTVHVDLDALAHQDLTDAVIVPPALDDAATNRSAKRHHGSGDERQEARQRSEREHASRAAGLGKGRSYAFRRS